jgi:hypothetical protein
MTHLDFNFAGWVQRAKLFVRGLARLPGAISIDDGIEPPAREDEHLREWLDSPACTVPPDVAQFIRQGSRRCFFRFKWKPPPVWKQKLREICASDELVGGGDLCAAAKYYVHDSRDRLREIIPAPQPWQTKQNVEMFGDRGDLFEILPSVGDGSVAIDLGAKEVRPILFCPSETAMDRVKLSDSFRSFLVDWESLCYVMPRADNIHLWHASESRESMDSGKGSMRGFLEEAGARWN